MTLAFAQAIPSAITSPVGLFAGVLVALFTGGGFAAMLTARSTRRNLDTDSLRKVADATVVLLGPMGAEIERLEGRVAKLSEVAETATRNYEEAEARVRLLTKQAEEIRTQAEKAKADFERARQLLAEHGISFS